MIAGRRGLSLGALVGALVGVVFVGVVTAIAGSGTGIWWWPAVAVVCVIGGVIFGSLFAAESEGASPDELYDVGSESRASDAARHS